MTAAAPAPPAGAPAPERSGTPWWTVAAVAALVVAVLAYALSARDVSLDAELLLQTARYVVAALLVVVVPGVLLARRLTPHSLAAWWPVLVLPLGLAGAMLGLTVLALLGLPPRPATALFLVATGLAAIWSLRRPGPRADWAGSGALLLGAAGAGLLTLVPVIWTHLLTVFGNNPDAHQVVGVVWFLQESYPLKTDLATALDKVPEAWAGRIPIFHPLGAATELGLTGPIQMFGPFLAVLTMSMAAGAGLLAAIAFRLPGWAAGLVALAIGGSAATLYSVLHPYYNQVWGMLLLVSALALAWAWLRDEDGRAGALALGLALLGLIAYPTTLPYVAVAVVAIAVAVRRRPHVPAGLRRRLRRVWPLLLLFFGLSVLWALGKVAGVLSQFLSGDGDFWQGDVNVFPDAGSAFGIDAGSWLLPVAIGLVTVVGLAVADRRFWKPWAVVAALLLIVDALLRQRDTAEYVDYKHVTFTALILLPLALGGALAMVRSRRPALLVVGLAVLLGWSIPALSASRDELRGTGINVTSELQDIQVWSGALPHGSSVLVDLPASGTQLWATLFLARDHPLAATDPVSSDTTYAVAAQGRRADYVLGLRHDLANGLPIPPPRWSAGDPLFANGQFAIWRMKLPAAADRTVPRTASDRLVQPHPLTDAARRRNARGQLTANPSTIPGF